MASRSRSRYLGAVSSGKLSSSRWAAQPAVGWAVTLISMSSRRACRRIRKPKSKWKVRVGTTKKSMATISPICSSRKVRQVEDGRGEVPHVVGHGELGDLIAEEAEFGLDPTPTPGRVVSGPAATQRAQLKIERGAGPWEAT